MIANTLTIIVAILRIIATTTRTLISIVSGVITFVTCFVVVTLATAIEIIKIAAIGIYIAVIVNLVSEITTITRKYDGYRSFIFVSRRWLRWRLWLLDSQPVVWVGYFYGNAGCTPRRGTSKILGETMNTVLICGALLLVLDILTAPDYSS